MSGGVDSSVAALLLKEQGYRVHGIFMQNWTPDKHDPYCTYQEDVHDAKAVAKLLDIPFSIINFSHEYWQRVFKHFLDEYSLGRTPNPDILCNKEIKFRAFLDYALSNGADFIATGHYARKECEDEKYHLLKAKDQHKDQSYFLHTLNQEQLKHSIFPLGDLDKSEVRNIAKKAGFLNHAKKDSTGICFIGERKFKNFLNEYLLAKPGDIIDTKNSILGKHNGLMFYTLGQRQGLGIGGKKNAEESPWYVIKKDIENNILVVDQNHEHPWLMAKQLKCDHLNWIANNPLAHKENLSCTAKIRYRQEDQACLVKKIADDLYQVEFEQSQRAITPGQSVVFYSKEICLGGGIINS